MWREVLLILGALPAPSYLESWSTRRLVSTVDADWCAGPSAGPRSNPRQTQTHPPSTLSTTRDSLSSPVFAQLQYRRATTDQAAGGSSLSQRASREGPSRTIWEVISVSASAPGGLPTGRQTQIVANRRVGVAMSTGGRVRVAIARLPSGLFQARLMIDGQRDTATWPTKRSRRVPPRPFAGVPRR
jgi:hypothetical protein